MFLTLKEENNKALEDANPNNNSTQKEVVVHSIEELRRLPLSIQKATLVENDKKRYFARCENPDGTIGGFIEIIPNR